MLRYLVIPEIRSREFFRVSILSLFLFLTTISGIFLVQYVIHLFTGTTPMGGNDLLPIALIFALVTTVPVVLGDLGLELWYAKGILTRKIKRDRDNRAGISGWIIFFGFRWAGTAFILTSVFFVSASMITSIPVGPMAGPWFLVSTVGFGLAAVILAVRWFAPSRYNKAVRRYLPRHAERLTVDSVAG